MTDTRHPTPAARRGPRTPEGKRRSSLNALKHGLTAASPQALAHIAKECGFSYEEALKTLRDYYRPVDPVEDELVKRIARCIFRLALTSSMEQRIIERNPSLAKPGPSYERIMRFERLVDIHLHRAIQALMRKREAEK